MNTQKSKIKSLFKSDWLFFIIGFILTSLLSYWLSINIYICEKSQPLNFSHKLHIDEVGNNKCKACHTFYENGEFTGIPNNNKCIECHSNTPNGISIEEKIFVENFLNKNKEVPWHVYSKQPNYVFFSHIAHIENAKLECTNCHRNHGTTQKLPPYKYNQLTNYNYNITIKEILGFNTPSPFMKMDTCTDCHQKNKTRNSCSVCHK